MPLHAASAVRWRYLLAALNGNGITDLSALASDRVITTLLNRPSSITGSVPSDNPQVWLPYSDSYGDPYLDEGTRLLWGLRRESETAPYYVVRSGTLVQLVEDSAQQDNARTRFVGYDPWQYLMSRPVVNSKGRLPDGEHGISWSSTQAAVIIGELLRNTIQYHGHCYLDAGDGSRAAGEGSQYGDPTPAAPITVPGWGGTSFYTGTLQALSAMAISISFQRGTTVGDALQQICDTGRCDIEIEPIYDPMNRPNYLAQLNVYAQAGTTRDEAIFAWDAPGRNITTLTRTVEGGTVRANKVKYYAQGSGSAREAGLATDTPSVTKYGQYWALQSFPGSLLTAEGVVSANLDAVDAVQIRADGRTTVTFTPAPERAPRPWQDYQLGDRCPVVAKMEKFRKDMATDPTLVSSSFTQLAYARIYGWVTSPDNNSTESVTIQVALGT